MTFSSLQDALLFNGTIRSNLDPFGQYEDSRLWDALKRAWLVDQDSEASTKVLPGTASAPTSRFSLDLLVEDEGLNFSAGERSLVSLARALVKDSKIIALDEATASVGFLPVSSPSSLALTQTSIRWISEQIPSSKILSERSLRTKHCSALRIDSEQCSNTTEFVSWMLERSRSLIVSCTRVVHLCLLISDFILLFSLSPYQSLPARRDFPEHVRSLFNKRERHCWITD